MSRSPSFIARLWFLAFIPLAAVVVFAGPRAAVEVSRESAPGDTVVVYGPLQHFAGAVRVEQIALGVDPRRRYTLRVRNGTPDGSSRVTSGRIAFNNWAVLSSSELGTSQYEFDRVVQPRGSDTLVIDLTGPPGGYVTVDVLETADASYALFGPERFAREGGRSKLYTRTFNVSAADAPPYRLCVLNGNPDGTQRLSDVTIRLNGIEVVSPSEGFSGAVASLVRDVALVRGPNTLEIMMPSQRTGFVDVCATATDVTPPVITIAAPAPGFATRDTQVMLSGTVGDQTATRVTVNGQPATRSGKGYSAVVALASDGPKTIHVAATDGAGLTTDSARSVIRDTRQPRLTVDAPADRSSTSDGSAIVSGSATDLTAVTVNANGVSLKADSIGRFAGAVPLGNGPNVITVTATDAVGNQAVVVRSVTRQQLVTRQAGPAMMAGPMGPSGWPNEPAGSNVVSEQTWDSLIHGWTILGWDTVNLTLAHDTSAPFSPTGVLQARFPVGFSGGLLGDVQYRPNDVNPTPRVYTGIWWKVSNPWQAPGPAIQILRSDAHGQISMILQDSSGVGNGPWKLEVASVNYLRQNVNPNASVTLGQWHQIEWFVDFSDTAGKVKWWLDGVLLGDYQHEPVPAGLVFNEVEYYIQWNQSDNGPKHETDYFWYDHTHISIPPADTTTLPPDPATVATPLSSTTSTSVATGTSFLYTGANPIQTGVAPGTIVPIRAAVVRGKVLTRDGQPLSGAKITILSHPELGQTLSRADGMFDLAVNGGDLLTVSYEKTGFLPTQRPIAVPWQDFVVVDDAALIPVDAQATVIDFTQPAQAARGSVVTDADGTRQATLIFQQGTAASMVLPDSSTQPLTSITVRATEYTVGAAGRKTMPAPLPPTSAYTYAVELSADEAIAAGATTVQLSKPAAFYVENFLDFPVGTLVPVGFYSRQKGVWEASDNGVVLKILNINGGTAALDVTGNGQPADSATLAGLGISDAERQRLAQLYQPGQTLWRFQTTHLSIPDCNWPIAPSDARAPDQPPPDKNKKEPDKPCSQAGESAIGCENQVLSEALAVTGTPFSLQYHSDRVPGRKTGYTIDIPLSGDSLQPTLKRIELTITIAGRQFLDTFPALPNQHATFTWDGVDAYGRPVQGQALAVIQIGYVYEAGFGSVKNVGPTFASPPSTPVAISPNRDRMEVTIIQAERLKLGVFRTPSALGGWGLSAHHAYDPLNRVLYLGDGTKRTTDGTAAVVTPVAGNGTFGYSGDDSLARGALLALPIWAKVGPDGAVYIADQANHRIRRISLDGIITTIAGNGQQCSPTTDPCGDGGPATQARLRSPTGVDLGRDGSLYIADQADFRVRRVGPDGVITTVAGTGVQREGTFGAPTGDGGPATQALMLQPLSVALAGDGSLYITDGARIRRVGPEGFISTVAGNDSTCDSFTTPCGEGGLATHVAFPQFSEALFGLAVGADGALYFSQFRGTRLYRVSPDGILRTFAGTGNRCNQTTDPFCGDGRPAATAPVEPWGMAFGPEGTLYVAELNRSVIRAIATDGTISTVAGAGGRCLPASAPCGNGRPAMAAQLGDPSAVAPAPDGSLYVVELDNNRVRKVASPLPGFSATDIAIASQDGTDLYQFDASGRHLTTINALTGSAAYTFSYSPAGLLTSVTDPDNNATVVERAPDGTVTAITSPFSARTTLNVNPAGFLDRVTDPAGQAVGLHHTATGLLDTLTTPRGHTHRFTYDSLGRLVRDQGASGEDLTIVRTELPTATETQLTTAEGRSTVYHLEPLATGALLRKTTDPAGLVSQVLVARSDSFVSTAANGTVTTITLGPDPRSGMVAPTLRQVTTQTPGGRTLVVTGSRVTTRPDSTNPLSLTSELDSVSRNGQWTVTSYTAATRHFVATSPEGRQRFATLDAKGRVIATQTAGLDSARSSYDNLGRLSQQQVGGRVFTYSYDARGRLLSTLDPLGRRDSLFYDGADRLIRRVLQDGRGILFAYDSSGNLTSLTPPSRPAHGFQYTASELTQQYDPPGIPDPKPTRYFYNRDKQVDSIVRPDSIAIRFGFDAGGRISSMTFDRGTLSIGYAPTTGNLVGIRAPTGDSLTFTYDGSLPTEARWVGTVSGRVGVAYNNDFRVVSQTVNGANPVSFGYDRDGLLTSAGALRLGRSPTNGLLVADTVVSVVGTYQYTSRGELKGSHVVWSGTTLLGTGYARDSLGRASQLFDTTQGVPTRWSFLYDSLGRLTADSMNGAVFHVFTYDANGNRLSFTSSNGTINYTYDAQDRLLSAGTTTYTYGSNGELKTKTVPLVGTTTYTYDGLGNLVTVLLPNGTRIDYVIDGQNRRVGRKVNGILVQAWLYQNQLNPVVELDGSGNVMARFAYGRRTNVPDYMVKNNATYRLVRDQLGSVRLVVDAATGAIVQRLDYDEWGNITQNTNPGFQSFGFAGGLYDTSTSLVRFGARDYDASVGRWSSKDPAGLMKGGINLYVYTGSDPVNLIDPSGLQAGWASPLPSLSDCLKDFLGSFKQDVYPDVDFDKVRFNVGGYVPEGFNGFTSGTGAGYEINFVEGWYQPGTADGVALIMHEMLHVQQYQQAGFAPVGFWVQYGAESVKQRLNGGDKYADNVYEVDAYALQDLMKRYLKSAYGDRGPCPNDGCQRSP